MNDNDWDDWGSSIDTFGSHDYDGDGRHSAIETIEAIDEEDRTNYYAGCKKRKSYKDIKFSVGLIISAIITSCLLALAVFLFDESDIASVLLFIFAFPVGIVLGVLVDFFIKSKKKEDDKGQKNNTH